MQKIILNMINSIWIMFLKTQTHAWPKGKRATTNPEYQQLEVISIQPWNAISC